MHKIYCVAPFILSCDECDYENLRLEFRRLVEENNRYTSLDFKDESNRDSRYQTLAEDSSLVQDNFFKVGIETGNDGITEIKIVGHQDTKENKNVFLVHLELLIEEVVFNKNGLQNLQIKCNNATNKVMDIIFSDMRINMNQTDKYLWVNRTLELPIEDIKNHNEVLKSYWCYTQNDIFASVKQNGYYVAWGNNLFGKETTKHKKDNLIDSILTIQYYAAIIDETNEKMKILIKKINELDHNKYVGRKDIEGYRNIKEYISYHERKTKHILIQYHDDLINLQGFRQYFASELVDVWKISDLISSIREKIAYCEQTVKLIEFNKQRKSRFITDMILFLVGLTSALSFSLSLGQSLDTVYIIPRETFMGRIRNLFVALYKLSDETFAGMISYLSAFLLTILVLVYIFNKKRDV